MKLHEISQAPYICEMCEATSQLWVYGWAERNGGNISYRLPQEEVRYYLNTDQIKKTVALDFTSKVWPESCFSFQDQASILKISIRILPIV